MITLTLLAFAAAACEAHANKQIGLKVKSFKAERSQGLESLQPQPSRSDSSAVRLQEVESSEAALQDRQQACQEAQLQAAGHRLQIEASR